MLASAASASGGGLVNVTLITGIVLAVAAIVSSLTPIALNWRKAQKRAIREAEAAAAHSGDLTLAGWTQLNQALQQEIGRLQGVTERMQARIDLLEAEVSTLQQMTLGLRVKGAPDGA